MPGAWEQTPPQVLVAVLAGREAVSTKWAIHYRSMQLPPQSDIHFLSGMPFDHARNTACDSALKGNFQWLFFLDDDVLLPPDTIPKLMSRNADIVSGLYYRRSPPIAPVALIDTKPRPTFIGSFNAGDCFEVDLVGAGCLLIHRRVLEAMKWPWFDWKLDRFDIPEQERCSEDFHFCREAKKKGFKVWIDTSVQCQHVGYGKSEIGGSYSPLTL
jgi:glycosyltransferase involved in cell wall biosynthesis